MSISLADYHQIDESLYDSTGALDPILDVDTRLFIDPALLGDVKTPELKDSHDRMVSYFTDVLKVVQAIGQDGDRMWRAADQLLRFPEVGGLSIGYSSAGTGGSGMGTALRAQLLKSIQSVVRAGVADPAIFEIVGIFEDGVGPDRISDMISKIIVADLIRFTQRVCSDCGLPMEPHRLKSLGLEEDLPTHPSSGAPLILVPKEILRDLPIAESFSDVRFIAEQNAELREKMNRLIGSAWSSSTVSQQKERLRKTFVENPDVLSAILAAYRATAPERYDFERDPAGEVTWYRTSKRLPASVPLTLSLSAKATIDEVESVVVAICNHFKRLIEENQLARLLYDKRLEPKHESASQLLFFGIASAYCEANDLDLSPESDGGRGPVDFKMSQGFLGKILVEVKLTSNKQLLHGFESQLPIYQKAERSQRGVYLLIDNGAISQNRRETFLKTVYVAGNQAPRVIWIDGVLKKSASIATD